MDTKRNYIFNKGHIKDIIIKTFLIKDMETNYQKKIEKISQAIYLVSNHLKDSEPLKWELRKESIGFLSCIRSLNEDGDENAIPADLVIDALSSCARDLASLISLATVSGLISHNNGNIINTEIERLLLSFKRVVNESTAKAGFILSEEFFAADPELQQHLNKKINKGQNFNFLSDKARSFLARKLPLDKSKDGVVFPKNESKSADFGQENIKDKKNTRQTRIITLLKTQSNLTIKDFAIVINDCSEKTIQRELIELVERGIVKKEGERRWSTYSLK